MNAVAKAKAKRQAEARAEKAKAESRSRRPGGRRSTRLPLEIPADTNRAAVANESAVRGLPTFPVRVGGCGETPPTAGAPAAGKSPAVDAPHGAQSAS